MGKLWKSSRSSLMHTSIDFMKSSRTMTTVPCLFGRSSFPRLDNRGSFARSAFRQFMTACVSRHSRTGWNRSSRRCLMMPASDTDPTATKRANKAGQPAAECVEERGPTKGNAKRTLHVPDAESGRRGIGLRGVREAARRDRKLRFTALLHHVTLALLRAS